MRGWKKPFIGLVLRQQGRLWCIIGVCWSQEAEITLYDGCIGNPNGQGDRTLQFDLPRLKLAEQRYRSHVPRQISTHHKPGTMRTSARHTACTSCRQRKVRCDGGQPCCNRCAVRGDECVYSRHSSQDQQELLVMLNDLNERLCKCMASDCPWRARNSSHVPGWLVVWV